VISVIIPTFNRQDKILNSINSILKFNCFTQIIVVDDKSTDDTLTILSKFNLLDYPKVDFKIIANNINVGVSKSRNNGIAFVKNHWYCFLDSDDTFLDFKESFFLKYFIDYNESAFLFFSCVNSNGTMVGTEFSKPKSINQREFLNNGTGGEKILFVNKKICKNFLFDSNIDGFEKLTIGRFLINKKAHIIPYKIRLYEIYDYSISNKSSLDINRLNNLINGHLAFLDEFSNKLSIINLVKTNLKIIYYKFYKFIKLHSL
jgi:glycosyltransferase involved in cell wall biosynthesis